MSRPGWRVTRCCERKPLVEIVPVQADRYGRPMLLGLRVACDEHKDWDPTGDRRVEPYRARDMVRDAPITETHLLMERN